MFMHPVPGPVTSGWGPRPLFGFHHGLDHGWLEDDPEVSRRVYALANGVVQQVGWNALVGYYILIRVSASITVRQAHFAKGTIAVKAGQRIFQGVTFLGIMGNSGAQVRGIHLHTDVFVKGVRVDPAPYFTIPFKVSKPKPVRKQDMPVNIVKKSTLASNGSAVIGKSEYATLGEPVNPVILYKRETDNDIAPALAAAYGPHTPVSDKSWADLIARYTPGAAPSPIATTVALSDADRALLASLGVKIDSLPAEIDRYADGKKQSQ